MQAVILAAGQSSRFYPYNITHKSLVKIAGKTILSHTLDSLQKTGINDIVIVYRDEEIIEILNNERNENINITYVKQPEPLGMGHAVLCAKDYIKSDFFLMHAHHVDFNNIKPLFDKKRKTGKELVLVAKEEEDISKYGVLKVEGDKVLDLVEKPKPGEAPSHLRIIGVYLLTHDFVQTLQDIPLEHYHFEKALATYAKEKEIRYAITDRESVSLKYSWDILNIKNYILNNLENYISPRALLAPDVIINGKVFIEDGAQILERTTIKGPCYIGKNSIIGTNTLLRNGVDIEANCNIGANIEVKNSLIMQQTTTHSGFIGDSIIGLRCKIGAEFCTANRRIDRKNVMVEVNKNKIDSKLGFLGGIIGNDIKMGIRVSTMPGIIIGNNVIVGPSTIVKHNTGDNVKYYSEFKEIISKPNE